MKLLFPLPALLLALLNVSPVLCLAQQNRAAEPSASQLHSTQAQKKNRPGDTATSPGASDSVELLRRVVGLLYSTAEDAKKWDDHEAAARVQAEVADLTWKADGETAQGHLLRAWETTKAITEERRQTVVANEYKRAEVRREIILIARRRAPKLASKWIAEMAAESESPGDREQRGIFDDRTEHSAILLRIAAQTVKENPVAAADLARESLRDGISFGLQFVLLALQAKDFELARNVFRSALARLSTVGMSDPGELLVLHSYLYTPGFVVGANQTENSGSFTLSVTKDKPGTTPAGVLDPALSRDFLKLAAELLIKSPLPSTTANPPAIARAQISAIQSMIGEITGQFPEEAAILKGRLLQIEADAKFAPSQVSPSNQTTDSTADATQDPIEQYQLSLEEQAEKEKDPLSRDILFARAALAASPELYERSLSLIQKIRDETLRVELQSLTRYRAAIHFALLGKVEKAYEINAGNPNALQRAACLVVGAQRLIKAKNLSLADQWLQEAMKLASKAEPSEESTRIIFGVTSAYAKFDRVLALEYLFAAIKAMNKSPVLQLDERAPLIQRISGLQFGDFTYDTSGFGLSSVISAFQIQDFDRVLESLSQINSQEKRGLAIVLFCRKHLQAQN